ncbi:MULTISPECIES: hypothetical protein [Pseudomonas]|uniref:Uncharacterized protein n=1 Tax=Pseudomonas monteilii TaxID=76759 RepID=A0A7W2LBJ7_9PSED|nr:MULTISPECIES: hypothetical protein [Pseudomonas]MBA6137884.1 hypothetical protein [Pseudomonas monteilii]MCA4076205.1 hypothetical protein [Pseudomonas kurunegalensis]MDT3747076.1 hypothetical protein [Pseudomonas kurunegalensis]MVF48929.1 hypothetical protein [Pseudomonas monteilii]
MEVLYMNERIREGETLEAPTIEGLTAFNEIDLDQLGSQDLETWVNYTGMAVDDEVLVRWLGRGAAGEGYDFTGTFTVKAPDLIDGMKVVIGNSYITGAAGGEAFYSYTRVADGPRPEAQSLRTFSYIGIRPRGQVEALSVLQVVHSHGLIIQPNQLPSSGMSVMVPRYQAMQVNDKVTLTVACYEPDGTLDDTWKKVVTVGEKHFVQDAISDVVPKSYFDWIDPGYVLASYEIEFAVGGRLKSPVQRLDVDSKGSLPGYLSKPAIDGYNEGDPLDPDKSPNGLLVKLPAYPGIADSDYLTLLWSVPGAGGLQYMPSARVDPSMRAVDSIAFLIGREALSKSQGTTVSVSYLYGREGEGLRSQVLQVDVQSARDLPVPVVEGATGDGAADSGNILADLSTSGVYINVPAGNVLPGEELHVHWSGATALGEYVAKAPVSPDKPLRFLIPPAYVPANMGRSPVDVSVRFNVFFRLVRDEDNYTDSPPYKLRIKPLDNATLPTVDLPDGPVYLSNLPAAGARLQMGTWMFIAPGQLLTIVMEGVDLQNNPVSFTVRDAKPVTADEARTGVGEMLPRSEFMKLKVGERFTLYARVSFNGGEFFLKFRSQSYPLNP